MLTVQPFDPGSLKAIEKAIMESDLGLTPSNDGKIIRLPIPQLTEERRKDLVKVVRQRAEDGKVAVRNVRRDMMKHLEELVRNGDVGDDDERRAEERVQKLTDEHVHKIDEMLKRKEAEILEVYEMPKVLRLFGTPEQRTPTRIGQRSPERSRSSWTATAAGRRSAAQRRGGPPGRIARAAADRRDGDRPRRRVARRLRVLDRELDAVGGRGRAR